MAKSREISQTRLQLVVYLLSFCCVWSFVNSDSEHEEKVRTFHRYVDPLHQYKDDISAKKRIPEEFSTEFRKNLRQRRDANPLKRVQDDHSYYKTLLLPNGNSNFWVDLSGESSFKKDAYLSNGALRYKNFQLKFTFPYYGHPVTNVSIASGGFLYVGYVNTRLIMKVMYIAPLMAFFNTSINETSAVHYFSNATQYTAQWSNVFLQNDPKVGPFTFQCTLYKDGRIVFAYKSLSVRASSIPVDSKHHVKIGISDAFVGYRWWFANGILHKIRIFYIYHSVKYPLDNITSNSSLIITPLPTCVSAKNCSHCINTAGLTDFSCAWCPALKRCSDGLDRHRFEWFLKSCNKLSIVKYEKCAKEKSSNSKVHADSRSTSSTGVKVGVIIAICLVLIVVIAVAAWCFYAYTHPVTRSGLFLIEFRHKPAQLFRRANAATSRPSTGATTGSSTA